MLIKRMSSSFAVVLAMAGALGLGYFAVRLLAT